MTDVSHSGLTNRSSVISNLISRETYVTYLNFCYVLMIGPNLEITATPVFLDFCEAFDSVPHERLLYKLKCYDIDGQLLEWFRNFLTSRQQPVIVRFAMERTRIKLEVPQGTILGPILFLI